MASRQVTAVQAPTRSAAAVSPKRLLIHLGLILVALAFLFPF